MKSLDTSQSEYVPISYIDVAAETTNGSTYTTSESIVNTATVGGSSITSGCHDNSRPHPHNAVGDAEVCMCVCVCV